MKILEEISSYLRKLERPFSPKKEHSIAVAYFWNNEILCHTYFKPETKESEYIDSFLMIGKVHGIRKLREQRYNIDNIHSFDKKKIEDIYSYFQKTLPDVSNNLDRIVFSNNYKFTKHLLDSLGKPVLDPIKSHIYDMAVRNPACIRNINRSLKTYLESQLPLIKEHNLSSHIQKTEKKQKNNKQYKSVISFLNPLSSTYKNTKKKHKVNKKLT